MIFLIAAGFLWLSGLSVVLFKFFVFFNKLTKGVEVSDIKKILEKVISKEEENEKEIKNLVKKFDFLEEDSKFHAQKIGLARFNPFKELGGDHSFSLAILDATDSGIIITSLHTRDRTRVYMKEIKKGKSTFELSNEEASALRSAQKNK